MIQVRKEKNEMSKRQRVEEDSEPLIPGLPDDVATLCLVRVPVDAHPSCRGVSKSWNSIFKRFSPLRKELGFRDLWLFIMGFNQHTDKIHFEAFNLRTLSWHTIHPTDNLYQGPRSLTSVSTPHHVFVVGGQDTSAVNVFLKYQVGDCPMRGTVIKATDRKLGRLTAGILDDGKLYVTGLDHHRKNLSVFDPEKGAWKTVPANNNLTRADGVDPDKATVFGGKLLLTYHNESMAGRIYDPRTDKWEDMPGQLMSVLRTSSTLEMHGHLFALAHKHGMRWGAKDSVELRVYDWESDSWDAVEGDAMPEEMWWASPVSSWDGKIYAVKDLLGLIGVVVGNVTRIATTDTWTKCRFRVEWEMVVDAPRAYCNSSPVTAHVLIA